jgi:predicted dinucleotide-binding enzyme
MLSKQSIESDNVSMKSSSEDDELKRAEEFKGKELLNYSSNIKALSVADAVKSAAVIIISVPA